MVAKTKLVGLVFVILMFVSIGGTAFFYGGYETADSNSIRQQENAQIPLINRRELTSQEKIFILQTGRVLFEYFSPAGCTKCLEKQTLLTDFTNQFSSNVILELVQSTNETLQMIDQQGSIKPIKSDLTIDSLTEFFCANSLIKPKQCLLREF